MTPAFISYAESSFDFGDGGPVFAFRHIFIWEDRKRTTRKIQDCRRAYERREGRALV